MTKSELIERLTLKHELPPKQVAYQTIKQKKRPKATKTKKTNKYQKN